MRLATRNTIVLSIASAVVLATSACGGGLLNGGEKSSDGDASAPVKIAMLVPMSGSSAPSGAYMKNGAQLASMRSTWPGAS